MRGFKVKGCRGGDATKETAEVQGERQKELKKADMTITGEGGRD